MFELIKEIKAIYRWRELLGQMVAREIKARYKQSILGYFWVILNPLAQMLVMSFAFSLILRIPTNASAHIPYSVFLFTALLPWNLFSTSLASSSRSLVDSYSLITKIYFPRSILVFATILSKVTDFSFALIILIGFMIMFRIPVNINLLWVLPIFLVQQMFTIGLALFFSASNLLYRDVQYLLALILSLWFYITPVIYPADLVPEQYRIIFQLNPMSVIINAYRQVVLGGQTPNYLSLITALTLSVLTLILGLRYFKSREKIFAESI